MLYTGLCCIITVAMRNAEHGSTAQPCKEHPLRPISDLQAKISMAGPYTCPFSHYKTLCFLDITTAFGFWVTEGNNPNATEARPSKKMS